MGAMTEDSQRGRKRNTVYKPSATYPQGMEGQGDGGEVVRGSSIPPFFSASLPLSMIVFCLLACFFICSYFLLPVHIIFFYNLIPFLSFPMIEYLTMLQFSHFISSPSPSLGSLWHGGAEALRKAVEGHNKSQCQLAAWERLTLHKVMQGAGLRLARQD